MRAYVAFTVHIDGAQPVVVSDGYVNSTSTKTFEEVHRSTQFVSADILSECHVDMTITQKGVLANSKYQTDWEIECISPEA